MKSEHADGKVRCRWAPPDDPLYTAYHDKEWGVPLHDDRRLFEFLILEGAQAGLSWSTILHKRQNYRKAFARFDPKKVAKFTRKDVARLMKDAGIVRNRLKIESSISNAQAFLEVKKEFRTFDRYIWSFVGGKPKKNSWKTGQVPDRTVESDAMSKDLKKRGFRFVGSTICYAFMQATGMVMITRLHAFDTGAKAAALGMTLLRFGLAVGHAYQECTPSCSPRAPRPAFARDAFQAAIE